MKNCRVHPSHWLISTQAAGCDWDQLLDAHGRDFEALFGQVNDATLQEATSAGNTIVHYLAQIGDVERLAVVLRRTVGRQIVHRRNARGHTALEYAAARGHHGVAQTLSCYNQEHLADDFEALPGALRVCLRLPVGASVADKTRRCRTTRRGAAPRGGRRAPRGAACRSTPSGAVATKAL